MYISIDNRAEPLLYQFPRIRRQRGPSSYVYDTELGLYYLQSRYYNPELGRFISSDVYTSTGQGLLGSNMFAYCRNSPVANEDITGTIDGCATDNNDQRCLPKDFGFATNSVTYGGFSTKIIGAALLADNGSSAVILSSTHLTVKRALHPISANRFNQDQQTLIELAKEYKHSGISYSDAITLVGWAEEYGISYHEPTMHPGRSGIWSHTLHIKIMNYHIVVI